LAAAQSLVSASQYDAAIAEAKLVKEPPRSMSGEIDLVLGDALLAKNEVDAAAERFRHYLDRERHPSQWLTVALRLAGALLGKPGEAHAIEAFRLAKRVETEGSAGTGAGNAKEIEKQALATIPFAKRKELEH